MDVMRIIEKYYRPDSEAYCFLVSHSKMVAKKALEVANRVIDLHPDLKFIEEASMLHDIGIFMTHAPGIGCHGSYPYISHGYLGREILEREGFPRHALVCERHVGVGLTIEDIERKGFPLPKRNMIPITLEEKIICFADKFYSKGGNLHEEKPVQTVREIISHFGEEKLRQFDDWLEFFKEPK